MNEYELIKEFRSLEEWHEFSSIKENQVFSKHLTAEIVQKIKLNGLLDPLTSDHFSPGNVIIKSDNYRETVRAGKLISRQRGILLAKKYLEKKSSKYLTERQTVIYAPEALTDFAMYLRSIYPRFIGSEYAVTEDEKKLLWPIVAQDLTLLSFDNYLFDCVITSDVLEHVYDLDKAISEIFRILNKNGVTISTFPFEFSKTTGTVKAKIEDNLIKYLADPEYHGNPMRPDEGSLVFEIPGWDLVERAKKIGFSDVFYCYVRSASHGVLTNDINGVFTFICIK